MNINGRNDILFTRNDGKSNLNANIRTENPTKIRIVIEQVYIA